MASVNSENFRATLGPKSRGAEFLFGKNDGSPNILQPLLDMEGIVFPYTPVVTFGVDVMYDDFGFTHSNFPTNTFRNSKPRPITIEATFTAQTVSEAKYLLAVTHFLRTVTKMYFGRQAGDLSGTPPPVFLFNYMGRNQFRHVPVLLKDYSYTLPSDIDYVPVEFDGEVNYVPTRMDIFISLITYYNPKSMRDSFNLTDYIRGKAINGGYI